MEEFKVCKSLSQHISAVEAGVVGLSDGTPLKAEGAEALPAAVLFAAQHERLRTLLQAYAALVRKDMRDVNLMMTAVEEMDAKLSKR